MLLDLWLKSAGEPKSESSEPQSIASVNVKMPKAQRAAERATLVQKLGDAWDAIEVDRDGVSYAVQLQRLLAHCSAIRPDEELVRELMDRMAGKDAEEVTQRQFLDYFCSLDEACALSHTLSAGAG